jgi:hypothetical protein
MRAPDKKVEVEKILVPISSDKFSDLTVIGKLITDYTDEAPAAAAGMLLGDVLCVYVCLYPHHRYTGCRPRSGCCV